MIILCVRALVQRNKLEVDHSTSIQKSGKHNKPSREYEQCQVSMNQPLIKSVLQQKSAEQDIRSNESEHDW